MPLRNLAIILLAVMLCTALLPSCKESCDDILCSPAPPVLEVLVLDTVVIDTTVMVYDTTAMDSVLVARKDTVTRIVTSADVLLQRLVNGNYMTFDSLTPSESSYIRGTKEGLPADTFLIVARRGERADTVDNAFLKQTEGCCSYPIVGRYIMRLPKTPQE